MPVQRSPIQGSPLPGNISARTRKGKDREIASVTPMEDAPETTSPDISRDDPIKSILAMLEGMEAGQTEIQRRLLRLEENPPNSRNSHRSFSHNPTNPVVSNLERRAESHPSGQDSVDRFIQSQSDIINQQAQKLRDLEMQVNSLTRGRQSSHRDHPQSEARLPPERPLSPPRRRLDSAFVPFETPASGMTSHSRPLKASDIGFFDPDDENVPVSTYVRRLRQLAARHGETAVITNLDQALVNVSSWLTSLTNEDVFKQSHLEGWIELLERDYGMSQGQALKKLHAFSYKDASSAMDYIAKKVSFMVCAGIKSDQVQCTELINSLPGRWREQLSIAAPKRVPALRSMLRDLELASGWPTERAKGREERDSRSLGKRGGFHSSGSWRDNKKSKTSTPVTPSKSKKKRENPPYACRKCESLGKPKAEIMHWHDQCPEGVKEKSKPVNRVRFSEDQESNSDPLSESETNSTTSSHSTSVESVNFLTTSCLEIQDRLPSTSNEIVEARNRVGMKIGNGNMFREHAEVVLFVQTSAQSTPFPVVADSGCSPTLIDAKTLKRHFCDAKIRTMETPLKICAGYNGREAEQVDKYIVVDLFLPAVSNKLVKIKVEIHLSNKPISGTGFLLGGDSLLFNSMAIDYPSRSIVILTMNGSECCPMVSSEAKSTKPESTKRFLRLSQDTEIPAQHGRYVRVDCSFLEEGSFHVRAIKSNSGCCMPNCIVSRDTKAINISNFGTTSRALPAGKIVGYISRVEDDTEMFDCPTMEDGRSQKNGSVLGDSGTASTEEVVVDRRNVDSRLNSRVDASPEESTREGTQRVRRFQSPDISPMMSATDSNSTSHDASCKATLGDSPNDLSASCVDARASVPLADLCQKAHLDDLEPDEISSVGVTLDDICAKANAVQDISESYMDFLQRMEGTRSPLRSKNL